MPNPPVRLQSTPISFKACEDPCRPLPDSHRAQHMAGYLFVCCCWIVNNVFFLISISTYVFKVGQKFF